MSNDGRWLAYQEDIMKLQTEVYEKHFGPMQMNDEEVEESNSGAEPEKGESVERDERPWALAIGALSYVAAWILWATEYSLNTLYWLTLCYVALMSYIAIVLWTSESMPTSATVITSLILFALPCVLYFKRDLTT